MSAELFLGFTVGCVGMALYIVATVLTSRIRRLEAQSERQREYITRLSNMMLGARLETTKEEHKELVSIRDENRDYNRTDKNFRSGFYG